MFEVCSEQRKGERISDLSTDIPELRSQQSTIKGVKEVAITLSPPLSQSILFLGGKLSCGFV